MPIFPLAEAGAGLHLPSNTALPFPKKNFEFLPLGSCDLITTLQHQKFQQSLSLQTDGKYIGKT